MTIHEKLFGNNISKYFVTPNSPFFQQSIMQKKLDMRRQRRSQHEASPPTKEEKPAAGSPSIAATQSSSIGASRSPSIGASRYKSSSSSSPSQAYKPIRSTKSAPLKNGRTTNEQPAAHSQVSYYTLLKFFTLWKQDYYSLYSLLFFYKLII